MLKYRNSAVFCFHFYYQVIISSWPYFKTNASISHVQLVKSHILLFRRYIRRKMGLVVRYSYNGSYRFCYSSRGTPEGSTPSLLLLHGFSASKDMWLTLVPVTRPLETQHSKHIVLSELFCPISYHLSFLQKFLPESQHVVCLDMPGHEGTSRTGPEDYGVPGQVLRVHQVCVSASPGPVQTLLLYNVWCKGQSSPFEALSFFTSFSDPSLLPNPVYS